MVTNSSLKYLTYALSVSFDPCMILAKQLKEVAYFLALWNWRMNNPETCVQEVMVSGSICQNHFLVVAVNVTVKHRHRSRDKTCNRSIWSLKASRWSCGSIFPLYIVMVDIWKLMGRGAYWISRPKGEWVVEGIASELLGASLSSLFLSSFISSCMGENVGTSFLMPTSS